MRREAWFWRVKAAQRDLIERCGGVRRAAEIAGCSHGWIGRCNTPNEDAFLSATQKRALETDAGEPLVTRIEAELLGFRLERASPPAPAEACAFGANASVMQEVGDLCRVFSQSVSDGRYSRTDALTVGRELAQLRQAIERFERVNATILAGGAA